MAFKLGETLRPELALAAPKIFTDVTDAGDIVSYLKNANKRYVNAKIHDVFAGLSAILDRCDGSDAPVGTAFMQGNILGLTILETALGSTIIEDLVGTDWFTTENKDIPEISPDYAANVLRAVLRGIGHAGFQLAEPYHPAIDDWDLQVTATVGAFKDGVGFPIFHAQHMKDSKASDGIFEAILKREGIFANWDPVNE